MISANQEHHTELRDPTQTEKDLPNPSKQMFEIFSGNFLESLLTDIYDT